MLLLVSLTYFQTADAIQPLPVDKAFQLNIKATSPTSFIAEFKIARGYYLYHDELLFKLVAPENASFSKIKLPEGIHKQDDIHGKYQVYKHNLLIPLTVKTTKSDAIHFTVHYQGCSEGGFCYPPVTKSVAIAHSKPFLSDDNNAMEETPSIAVKDHSESATAASLLGHQNKFLALLTFFGFGLLLAFTPCILPMLPILSGIIVGQGKDITTYKAFLLSLTYVLTMALTYAVAGVLLATAGSNVQAALQQPVIIIIFSLLFVALSLSLFGFYELQMPASWQAKLTQYSQKQQAGTYVGVAIMGFLSTLIVSPCVTAPLVGALTYIANTGNVYFGGGALFALGMGMGLPLLVAGTSFGKFLPKAGTWMEYIKKIFGILMLAVAILMLSRIFNASIILALWGIWVIISALLLFNIKFVKFAFLSYALVMIIGAVMGNTDPLRPLTSPFMSHHPLHFTAVKNIATVKQQLQLGAANHQFTLLDFSAEWCTACKIMEKHTFTDPEVTKQLKNFHLVLADVTSNDKEVRELQKSFGVLAPPTLLFFDSDGHELKDYRITGEIGPKQMNDLLAKMIH
jgi:thiol:disulfide interchange protein DsbD